MSDIFHEVDEEVRREQLRKMWERHGKYVIAACILLVAAVGGWRFYEWNEAKKAAETGAQFEAAMALVSEGKNKEAEEAFARLATASSSTSSYRMLARFREAGELARHDPKAAVAIYDQLAADSGNGIVLQDLAAVRAGTILVDTAPYGDIRQRLEPLTAQDRAFRHSARSMLALSAWKANDTTVMRRWTDMILADPQTPPGTRGQIQMLLALSDTDKKS